MTRLCTKPPPWRMMVSDDIDGCMSRDFRKNEVLTDNDVIIDGAGQA